MKAPKRQGNHLAPLRSCLDHPSFSTVGQAAALPGITWLDFFMKRDFGAGEGKPSQAKLCKLIWVYVTKSIS